MHVCMYWLQYMYQCIRITYVYCRGSPRPAVHAAEKCMRRPSRDFSRYAAFHVHIAHTRYTHTCVITVSPHMWIQIYCTVLYCLPYCLVVSYMPPPHW